MKIGTLSFELKGHKMALKSNDRLKMILEVVRKYQPDLLLCAGSSLENNSDLIKLKNKLDLIKSKTTLIVEVINDHQILKITTPGNMFVDYIPSL